MKNDAVEGKTLAQRLRTNLLPEVWIASLEVPEAGRLLCIRALLGYIRTRLKCQVRAICADAGVPLSVSDLFGRRGRGLLNGLALRPISAGRLAASLRHIDGLGVEIAATERESGARVRGDERLRRVSLICTGEHH